MKNFVLALLAACCSAAAADIHLSPQGDDRNDGSASKPLQSLAAAQKAARSFLGKEAVTVHLHGGVYHLSQPLVFTAVDSGTAVFPVLWQSVSGEDAVISGGAVLKLEWKPWKDGIFQAQVPAGIDIDQLFINGARQVMARYPDFDVNAKVFNGTASDCVSRERAARWADPAGGFMHAMHEHHWGGFSYRIIGKDENGNVRMEGGWQGNRASAPHHRDRYVENIFEELDAPGEWFFNSKSRSLYYHPPAGIDLGKAQVEAARLKNLIEFRGDIAKPVQHVALKGLTFRHSVRTFMETKEPLLRTDWTICRAGALYFEGATDCSAEDCFFDQLGGNAIFASGYNRRLQFRSNRIYQAGAGGIMFVGLPKAVRNPLFEYNQRQSLKDIDLTPGPKTDDYPADCLVEDCLIHEIGRVEKQATGVGMDMAARITVRHCSIYDMPRAGINIGDGCWGGHIVEGCDVFDTVKETGDHGSFNSWGRDRFWGLKDCTPERMAELAKLDVVETNILRNSRWRCDHGWDIDLDDGSSNYQISGNLLLNGGLKLREGFYRKATGNIVINNGLHPHVWYPHCGDEVSGNLFMAAHAPAVMPGGTWPGRIDGNFFSAAEDCARFLKQGCDAASKSGEPGFNDPTQGDFSFKASSAAKDFGIPSLPKITYGVRIAKLRAIARCPEMPSMKFKANSGETLDAAVWLQAKVRDIGGEEFSAYGVARVDGGIAMEMVSPDSAASRAGFLAGDLILGLNGVKTPRIRDFLKQRDASAGKPLVISLVRGQKPMTLRIESYEFVVPGKALPGPATSGRLSSRPETRNEALGTLVDGALARNYGAIFGNDVGRGIYKMDLGAVQKISAINTWSFNQDGRRSAQRLIVYASVEDPGFDLSKCQPLAAIRADADTEMVSTQLKSQGLLATARYVLWVLEPLNDKGEHSAVQELSVE
ncbi:MAG: hypothetical protein RL095_3546 [Verrucomicrobiota bacterium]|jgi:hypothetical protein